MRLLDDYTYSLITREGFVETFWREVALRRKADPSVTQRQVYESMEAARKEEFGAPLFPSWDSFRMFRDNRKRSKHPKQKK